MAASAAPEPFYRRFGGAILLLAAASGPLVVWGVLAAIRSNSNDVRDWLPAQYVETQQYRWFQQHFGEQDFIVASWPGCTLDDPRLDAFAQRIEALSGPSGPGESRLFSRVLTGRSLLNQLTAPPIDLNREDVATRLRGSVVGPDGQQTCAVVTLREDAPARLEAALDLIEQAAAEAGVPRGEVRLGGIPVINSAINCESTQSLVRLAGLSGLLGVGLAWLCFRDWRLTALVLAIGVWSAAASLAIVPLFGVPLNAILITMVPLVYVTAISGAIHLTNYYREAAEHTTAAGAPGWAVAHAALPLTLAAVTTIVGLLSLCYSDLYPIYLFGAFSAIGVAVGGVAQVLLLPAALAIWTPLSGAKQRPATSGDAAGSSAALLDDDSRLHQPAMLAEEASHLTMWPKLGEWITARPGILAVVGLGIVLAAAAGLPRIHTSIQMMRLFRSEAPVIPMTQWLEQHLGATIPLEVVLCFGPESATQTLDRVLVVAEVDAQLRRLPEVTGTLSVATFAPPQLDSAARGGVLRRSTANAKLKRNLDLLLANGWVARDGDQELWRINLRVRGSDDLDFLEFADSIRKQIAPVLDARLGPGHSGVEAVVTGTAPIVYQARRSLLDGMLFGLATDVILIVAGVILATRSVLTGGVMFLLSVFPTALVFGAMGWLGIVVDIGSVMTPCVAVGVTVDDVFHFLLWHRRGVQRGLSCRDATRLAYQTCGRAMVQSWGIIGVGLAAFALSSFVPIFRFGMLMLLLLTAGLIGNLILLPALLAGPVGRWVTRSVQLGATSDDKVQPAVEPGPIRDPSVSEECSASVRER